MGENTENPAVNEESRNPSDIFNQRVAKVAELRAMGVDPLVSATTTSRASKKSVR